MVKEFSSASKKDVPTPLDTFLGAATACWPNAAYFVEGTSVRMLSHHLTPMRKSSLCLMTPAKTIPPPADFVDDAIALPANLADDISAPWSAVFADDFVILQLLNSQMMMFLCLSPLQSSQRTLLHLPLY